MANLARTLIEAIDRKRKEAQDQQNKQGMGTLKGLAEIARKKKEAQGYAK